MEFKGDRSADHAADYDTRQGADQGVDLLVREGLGFDPFMDSPSVILDRVCDLEPGLFVQSVLEMLDPAALSPRDALRYLQVHDRVTSWWASRQSAALIAAAGTTPTVEQFVVLDRLSNTEREVRITELARDEVAAALRWGPVSTQSRIDQARLLAGPLTATQTALSLGEVTGVHVRLITEAAQRLSTWDALNHAIHNAARQDTPQNQRALTQARLAFTADCVVLQQGVLPTARAQGYSRTKSRANKVIDVIDAHGQARRRAAARRHRDVYVSPDLDGISTLIARLDTFTANAIMGAINAAVANPNIVGSCDATVGERRAEALTALIFGTHLTGTHVTGTPNTGVGCTGSCITPIAVNITVDLTVPITKLNSKLGTGLGAGLGGDAFGCDFRQLLADPAVKVFTRPAAISDTGHVLDVGRKRYQITGSLRRLIITRDGSCRFPGCNATATRCHIDHATPWDEGGRSDVGNLGVLCVRHHQLKTHGGWQLTNSKADGSCTWRSPQGLTYHHYPEPIITPTPKSTSTTRPQRTAQLEPPDTPPF